MLILFFKIEKLTSKFINNIIVVVDSEDIDLNVSREMMQSNAALNKISKALVNKILSELKKDFEKNRDDYEKFFNEFGAAFKEGIYEDFERKKSKTKSPPQIGIVPRSPSPAFVPAEFRRTLG